METNTRSKKGARLSPEELTLIFTLDGKGISGRGIARKTGIPKSTIQDALRRTRETSVIPEESVVDKDLLAAMQRVNKSLIEMNDSIVGLNALVMKKFGYDGPKSKAQQELLRKMFESIADLKIASERIMHVNTSLLGHARRN